MSQFFLYYFALKFITTPPTYMTTFNASVRIVIPPHEIMRHALAWLLIWCFMIVVALEADWPFWFSVATQTPYFILYVTAFYSILYQICPFWHQDKMHFLLGDFAALVLFTTGYVFLDLTIPEYVAEGEAQPTYPFWSHIIDATYMFLFIQINVLGLYFQKYNIAKVEANSKKAIALVRREERLIRQELNFYKSEFNTHITFNTLSHIYAKVMDDPALASPVLMLSEILRYNLRVQAHREVALSQEVEYIKSFLEIHRLLFPQLQVDFSVEGELEHVRILPRILIGFIENAIKHGDKRNVHHPIKIKISVEEGIHLRVENKKRQRHAADNRTSTKTGIKNARNTLKAFYQDRHHLTIQENDDYYRVYLKVAPYCLLGSAKNKKRTLVPFHP